MTMSLVLNIYLTIQVINSFESANTSTSKFMHWLPIERRTECEVLACLKCVNKCLYVFYQLRLSNTLRPVDSSPDVQVVVARDVVCLALMGDSWRQRRYQVYYFRLIFWNFAIRSSERIKIRSGKIA